MLSQVRDSLVLYHHAAFFASVAGWLGACLFDHIKIIILIASCFIAFGTEFVRQLVGRYRQMAVPATQFLPGVVEHCQVGVGAIVHGVRLAWFDANFHAYNL